jgi:hypothetical protein
MVVKLSADKHHKEKHAHIHHVHKHAQTIRSDDPNYYPGMNDEDKE